MKDLFKNKETFRRQQQTINKARITLKQEFVGIDKIIDNILDNVSYWYSFNYIQSRPLVVNLWGLTGVGKTSLINRLVELIDFKDRYYRFDMGKKKGFFSFSSALDDLCEQKEKDPVIIALDEFQHARTISGPFRAEQDDENSRMVWELIDSGKVRYYKWLRELWDFNDMVSILAKLSTAKGVRVENGYVVKNQHLFCKEMKQNCNSDEKILFVNESYYDLILELAGKKLDINLRTDLEKMLLNMNANETIRFLDKVIKIGKSPAVKNFTSALIFVLGNLDEAYTMGSNFNVDIDADKFYKESLRIDITKIKKALRGRFRDEQIARLGNIHIIYPAFNKASYRRIIKNALDKLSEQMQEICGVDFEIEQSIHDLIYREGVYPVQGARPLFTTINHLLLGNMAVFLLKLLNLPEKPAKIHLTFKNSDLICLYYSENRLLDKQYKHLELSLENIRNKKSKELQVITAVHESGHAILESVLLNQIPNVIFSLTADSDVLGFTYANNASEIISRSLIIPKVATMLGGYVAEEVVFGKENLTAGAGGDVEAATSFLFGTFANSGMGETPISYGLAVKGSEFRYHNYASMEEQIKFTIEKAKDLARNTLQKEMRLLLKMSAYLADNSKMENIQIRDFLNKYAKHDFANGKSRLLNYRRHLEDLIRQQETLVFENGSLMVLNKER